MTEQRFTDLPDRMRALPVDKRGFPVPKFVEWIEGEPDFRVIDAKHLRKCIRHGSCWICGERLGAYKAFVIGPMCCINRISAEPPSHFLCAEFAAKHCPFLSQPLAKRNMRDLPPQSVNLPGAIAHNPEVTTLWVTKSYELRPVGDGVLFRIGAPLRVLFYRQGRLATRAEVERAVEKGLPILLSDAAREGPAAGAALLDALAVFDQLVDDVLPVKSLRAAQA